MKILRKKILVDTEGLKIVRIRVASFDISKRVAPGQFVVLMVSENGERIPLTVVEKDEKEGWIDIIFQEAGLTTKLLGKIREGEKLFALTGPLGRATDIKKYGKIVVVGGGVGIAEIYPVAKSMKACGNEVTVIIGAKNKNALILEEELKNLSDNFYVVTDDGSKGRKAFTTEILSELLESNLFNLVYAVGPVPMMKKVSELTQKSGVMTLVSLNALMVDATGMCGCCRVTVQGEVKFSCVDGPEFQAHMIDWEELDKRNKMYMPKEEHICRLNNL